MAYILNLETATKNCSVAVAKNGQVLAFRDMAELGYSHAEKLHVFIEEVLKEVGLQFKDLDAIAVGQGPGSYTGLRIGVSAAKGLAFALGIPLIAVDTLAVLAAQAKVSDGSIVPLIDARRMEVYSAVFDSDLNNKREVQAEIITESSFGNLEGNVYFVGDCLDKCKTVLTKSNFVFLDAITYPSAKQMAAFSNDQYQKNDTVDVAFFEPFYLKDFMITSKKES